jgi:phage antirepressor YoqD-like protein
MRSKLESAEAFQDWIVEEVIPSIRKTGSYQLAPSIDPTKLLNDPAAMRGLLLGYTEKVLELEAKVEEIQPKADALDLISGSEGSINITNSAKTLKVQPKKLFSWLQTHGWIYRRPGGKSYVAYQQRLQSGLLEHKVASVKCGDGSNKVVEQVLITPKGLSILSLLKIAA